MTEYKPQERSVRKDDVVTTISRIGNITKKDAEVMYDLVVTALEEIVIDELYGLTLGKLGSFRIIEKQPRQYSHPVDKNYTIVKPHRMNIAFKVNKTTQEDVEKRTGNKV